VKREVCGLLSFEEKITAGEFSTSFFSVIRQEQSFLSASFWGRNGSDSWQQAQQQQVSCIRSPSSHDSAGKGGNNKRHAIKSEIIFPSFLLFLFM